MRRAFLWTPVDEVNEISEGTFIPRPDKDRPARILLAYDEPEPRVEIYRLDPRDADRYVRDGK